MKTLTNTIISQAIELGFDFEEFSNNTDLHTVLYTLKEYFNDNADLLPQIEDECEVDTSGRTQSVSYRDYFCSGEIVDFSAHWGKKEDTKIYHTEAVMQDSDGLMKNFKLYYLVGKTEFNQY